MNRRYPSDFTVLGWILVFMMALFLALVTVPEAKAESPPRARLVLEIEDKNLRIFEYETSRILCHLSIMEVRMIGMQHTLTCVKKDVPKYRDPLTFEYQLTPRGDLK